MDISTKKPGWEQFTWEDITCDIKHLTNEEGFDLRAALQEFEGARGVFTKEVRELIYPYIQKIKNLKVDGKEIKKLADLFDPSIGMNDKLDEFYIAVVNKFFEMYNVSEEERKNSNAPPVEHEAK